MLHRIHIHELDDNFLTGLLFFRCFYPFFFYLQLLKSRDQDQLIEIFSCRKSHFFFSIPVFLQVLKGTQCLPTNVITHVLKRVHSSFNHETQELDFQKCSLCVIMFCKSYLYRHVCALSSARVKGLERWELKT